VDSILANPITLQAQDMMSYATDSFQSDPTMVEGEFFSVMSHVVSNFAAFIVGPENKDLLHLMGVIGIVSGMLSDYIPDHCVRPDNAAFQVITIALSLSRAYQNVFPRIQLLLSKLDSQIPNRRDVIAYRNIFEPVGFTWIQFRTLLASKSIEWIEDAPSGMSQFQQQITKTPSANSCGTDENNRHNVQINMHWIYDNKTKSFESPNDIGSLASMQFLQKMDKRIKTIWTIPKLHNTSSNDFVQHLPRNDAIIAEGASLLQVNTENLIDIIKDNEDISVSMRFLALDCIQYQVKEDVFSKVKT
jgi:hypothetical protein